MVSDNYTIYRVQYSFNNEDFDEKVEISELFLGNYFKSYLH